MKCVLLGLLGAGRSFSPATIRCASAKIRLSCRAVTWALKSLGASCSRPFCSCRSTSRRFSGSLGFASYRRNAPSLGSGRPSKYRLAGCSRLPFSYGSYPKPLSCRLPGLSLPLSPPMSSFRCSLTGTTSTMWIPGCSSSGHSRPSWL